MSDEWKLAGSKKEIEHKRKILSHLQTNWGAFVQRMAITCSVPNDIEIVAPPPSECDEEMQAISLAGYALALGINPVLL